MEELENHTIPTTRRECEICKSSLEKDMQAVEKRMDQLESKFWSIILLLIANLGGVIALFLKVTDWQK